MTPQQALAEAVKLHQAGRLAEAERLYARVLAAVPNHVDALHLSGMLASQSGRQDRAVALIGKAIALSPRPVAPFHNNIGLAYRALGRVDDAVTHFRRAIAIDRNYADAHSNLGGAFQAQGQLDQAVSSYRRAIALKSDHAGAHYNLGLALKALGQIEDAAGAIARALALRPGHPEAHNNLGGLLRDQGRLGEAVAQYQQALALRPGYADAHFNLGMALHELGQVQTAIACYRRALTLKPDDVPAHVNLAMAQLLLGDFAGGWAEYEWRWRMPWVVPQRFPAPLWAGEPVADRTILLHAEQGFGDTLQFVRYASRVAALGARVLLRVPRPLACLMENVAGVASVYAEGDELPAFDVHCPLMSLPRLLGTTPETIPAAVPYLRADSVRAAAWAARLAALPAGLKIGLVWAGAPRPFHAEADAIDRKRSLALARFADFAGIDGVTFVSLQKGPPAAQVHEPPSGLAIVDWTDELGDFADTAALIAGLDLVIGADTAVVHLAGALGKPVWLLNRFDTCWRWFADRDDSPWYPTLRQFRQPAPGDWAAPLARAAEALAALCAGKHEAQ